MKKVLFSGGEAMIIRSSSQPCTRPTTMFRSILSIDPLPIQRHGTRLVTRDVQGSPRTPDLDPFIAVSLYDMSGPTFPPHPHAGFMVATYIVPESPIGFVNQDSLGTQNRIEPGALHVTIAGRGVLHEEQPASIGPMARGYQIWIDLPESERERDPAALHLGANEVPWYAVPGGRFRVVLGESGGQRSPLGLPTAVTLIDGALEPGGSWNCSLPTDDNAFVFVIEGQLDVNGHTALAGSLVRTRADGSTLAFAAGNAGARFTLFGGRRLHQSRLQHGPFVARDADQLARFMRNHAHGLFGELVPFAHHLLTNDRSL